MGIVSLLFGGGLGLAGIALRLLLGPDKFMAALRSALGIVRDTLGWLFRNPMVLVAVAGLVFGLLQWQNARHWRKADANDVAARHELASVLGRVKTEVDRGVCADTPKGGKCRLSTRPDQADFYIRRFVDNVVTLKGALDREETAIRRSAKEAADVRTGAHEDAQPTAGERQRDKTRHAIDDPARTTGLSAQEWSQL